MKYAVATAAICVALTACSGFDGEPMHSTSTDVPPPTPPQFMPNVDLLPVLSVQLHVNPAYAASTDLFETAQGDPWSPYLWAENAAALPSLSDQPDRLDATHKALLDELAQHAIGGLVVADYDLPNGDLPVMHAPWLSAFSNAVVAIGLMNLNENAEALKYLAPISVKNDLAFRDDGYLWFSEYVDPAHFKHIDVMDGHFYAVGAQYEYWRRTGDTRFQGAVLAGLQTMAHELPLLISGSQECFLYARESGVCDYGQQRAVNFAKAACQLYQPICSSAEIYEQLFTQWNPS